MAEQLTRTVDFPRVAAILAGGLGTRLRPLTSHLPKPMVPVVNRPALAHLLNHLRRHGIEQVVMLLFYRPEIIRHAFGDGSRFGLTIRYSEPQLDYGTAGAVRQALHLLGERFFVLAGDVVSDVDLQAMASFHRRNAATATLALVRVLNPTRFGIVVTDKSGRVQRFREKPSWGQVFSDTINAGVYLLEAKALEEIPPDVETSFEHEVFPNLLRRGERLFGYLHEGYWRDLGNLDEYHQVNRDALAGRIQLEIPGQRVSHGWFGDGVQVDATAEVVGPVVLGDGVRIEAGAHVERSVLGSGCHVAAGARVVDAVLWERVTVGEAATVEGALIASDVQIGRGACVPDKVVVAEGSRIGAGARLHEGVKIWPGRAVEDGATVTSSIVGPERWARGLFEESRITGAINQDITPEFGARLGAAYGAYLGPNTYVVASRDVSPAARMMNRALICGLMSTGVHVEDLRVTPIPVVRYALRAGREVGGFYVRKSPFDPNLLDVVFYDRDGRDLPVPKAKTIERLFFREEFPRAAPDDIGHLDFPVRVIESYIEDFLQHVDVAALRNRSPKVVVDYSYGAASSALPQILGALDVNVISLNAYADPRKLTRSREDFHNALAELSTIVTSVNADAGFLIDAGAEKLFVVDEKGRFVDSERLLLLVTRLVLEYTPVRTLAVPVTASYRIEELASSFGANVYRMESAPRALVEACLSGLVQFAGDGKGGFIFADFHFAFDAMFAFAKLLELLTRSDRTLGELDRELPEQAIVRFNVPCPWSRKGEIMRRLLEVTAGAERDLTDGIRIRRDGAWVLLLPDHTRPLFHVNAEADDPLLAANLAREYRDLLRAWLKEEPAEGGK
ncbi:MAG TPA: nucleotidyltransferase [Bacteroidetes bacterium]|nr:nucleotidyltransferase [Bacteroidota bacterium]